MMRRRRHASHSSAIDRCCRICAAASIAGAEPTRPAAPHHHPPPRRTTRAARGCLRRASRASGCRARRVRRRSQGSCIARGRGSVPVVVWNHGAEQRPGWQPDLAHFLHRARLGVLASSSPRTWTVAGRLHRQRARQCELVALNDEHNADVVAAIAWIKTQPGIDPARVVVSGCSFGGSRR